MGGVATSHIYVSRSRRGFASLATRTSTLRRVVRFRVPRTWHSSTSTPASGSRYEVQFSSAGSPARARRGAARRRRAAKRWTPVVALIILLACSGRLGSAGLGSERGGLASSCCACL